jgi:hypothetical protein
MCHIFPHYLIFGKKVIEHKMCVLIFSTFVWNIPHSNKNSARYCHKCIQVFHTKYSLFLPDFNQTWIFSTEFRKILKYQIFRKSVQWKRVVLSGQTDGRSDRHDELTVTFRDLASAPKNGRRGRWMREGETVTRRMITNTTQPLRTGRTKSFIDIINTNNAWG